MWCCDWATGVVWDPQKWVVLDCCLVSSWLSWVSPTVCVFVCVRVCFVQKCGLTCFCNFAYILVWLMFFYIFYLSLSLSRFPNHMGSLATRIMWCGNKFWLVYGNCVCGTCNDASKKKKQTNANAHTHKICVCGVPCTCEFYNSIVKDMFIWPIKLLK